MLPCGHQLCVRCHMAILDRIPPNTPMVRPSAISSHNLHVADMLEDVQRDSQQYAGGFCPKSCCGCS